ncbi:MAG: TonB-dependent receptor [Sphingomonas sp.]|jgi:hypothetical protein
MIGNKHIFGSVRIALVATSILATVPAFAQLSTSTVRGTVTTEQGAASGAQITVANTETGQIIETKSGGSGDYNLAGLKPGTYDITVVAGEEKAARRVTILVGQTVDVDIALSKGDASTDIIVLGYVKETKTSEIATNVTAQQIRTLPQTDRNFLAFTALAPGVRFNDNDGNNGTRSFTSGASPQSQVNISIDGQSLKSDVLASGFAGQDSSRGNPFPQLAIGEFRVLTQNFAAEYEQAGAATITSITKSGTNTFHGEAFGSFTNKDLIERGFFDKRNNNPKPDFQRVQYGAGLGGPIIKDKLFFFVSYEGNEQTRSRNVVLGSRDADNLARFGSNEGNFSAPFNEKLFFGKITYQPSNSDTIDLSSTLRRERNITDFGGQDAFSRARNIRQETTSVLLKHTHRGDNFLNEASIDYFDSAFQQIPIDTSPAQIFQGVINIGGNANSQNIAQKGYTFRENATFDNIDFAGTHVIKAGFKLAFKDYTLTKSFAATPQFVFREDSGRPIGGIEGNPIDPNTVSDFSFPVSADLLLGSPDATVRAKNTQFGIYVQDDWKANDKLTFNIGLRWDYESNLFDNDYVTPANAAAAIRTLPATFYFDPENYITDGTNRKPRLDLFQPRLGFSYDLFGDKSTVIFGGAGRYYDRNNFNNVLDERIRLLQVTGSFQFTAPGTAPGFRNGQPTVAFDPIYLTADGLRTLAASNAQLGVPELFAAPNNALPPRTDQYSLGVRRKFGAIETSITGSYIYGSHGYTHLFATRNDNGLGSCCDTSTVRPFGFGNVLIGSDSLETKYLALYVTIDKPYTQASGYGFNIAYTLAKGRQTGNDLFSLDYLTPRTGGFFPSANDETHRIVASGQVDLPFGLKFSTLSTLGSGTPYDIADFSRGFDFGQSRILLKSGRPPANCLGVFAFCEFNFTLQKEFSVYGGKLGAAVDIFNAFDNKNFGGFDGFVPPTPEVNTNLGNPSNLITQPRSVQFRVFYRF